MDLPPDRSHVQTEHRHDRSSDLDALSTRDAISLIVDDHQEVLDALRGAAAALTSFIDALTERMRDGGRLIYIGAGTSGRLGVLDAAECPPTFYIPPDQVIGIIAGGDAALRWSSEAREDDSSGAAEDLRRLHLTERDTVVGIAAGGTTPYVLGAIALAKRGGALTALLTSAPGAVPPEGCDHLIVLETGPELLTGSTRLKAGSGTKLALNIITTVAFTQLGKVYSNLMVDLRATNDKLLDRAIRILMELCPELDRPAAAQKLREAGNRLKTAIIMQRRRLGVEVAEALLAENDGRLRPILDS